MKCTFIYLFILYLPNPDLPYDKTESSITPGENRNWNRVERAFCAWVAWQPGCKFSETLEMHLLDPGQGLLPFLSDIFLPSVQWQRLMGWHCKNSGLTFARWDLWLKKKEKKIKEKQKTPNVFSLIFFFTIFDGSFIMIFHYPHKGQTKEHEQIP